MKWSGRYLVTRRLRPVSGDASDNGGGSNIAGSPCRATDGPTMHKDELSARRGLPGGELCVLSPSTVR